MFIQPTSQKQYYKVCFQNHFNNAFNFAEQLVCALCPMLTNIVKYLKILNIQKNREKARSIIIIIVSVCHCVTALCHCVIVLVFNCHHVIVALCHCVIVTLCHCFLFSFCHCVKYVVVPLCQLCHCVIISLSHNVTYVLYVSFCQVF